MFHTRGSFKERQQENLVSVDKFQRFEAWLRENGSQIDLLELREYDTPKSEDEVDVASEEEKKEPQASEESEMRGVHSRIHIPPNTVCLVVPRKCLITVEMGQATPLGQAILNSDLDLDAPKHIFLMIYILWDRKVNGVNSFFHPYYEILPRTLRNMPIFWSPEELELLEGSYMLEQIADRNDAIAEDYHSICSVAPELQDICTLEEFKWARMCVCSRNFGLQIDGHRTSAMVPHADMLNHYRPRETKWTFDEERQAFTITTLQSIPLGAQVYDSYGQKCNHRFLLNYGFAVENNRELDGFCPNEVPIELFVPADDPLHDRKLEFWVRGEGNALAAAMAAVAARQTPQAVASAVEAAVRHRAANDSAPVKRVRVCVSNNENTRLLFSLLRALACNEEELTAITSSSTAEGGNRLLFGVTDQRSGQTSTGPFYRSCRDIRHPISLRNEKAAMMLLLEVIGRALAKYPTTLAQDVADLMDEVAFPRFSNRRHARIQVRGEKEVLHHFARWARTALDVMDTLERELSTELGGGVEVQLGGSVSEHEPPKPGFEEIVHRMEQDEGIPGLHLTIVRYCADVLGSLRREEFKRIRRQKPNTIGRPESVEL